ncbi:MAG: hypothetical protein IPL27_18410 [Lewinellaceae bacterium]|nr:hypothetical protein [Lewinellaceae bacterium]
MDRRLAQTLAESPRLGGMRRKCWRNKNLQRSPRAYSAPDGFYPGKVLGIINDLGTEIRDNDLENIRLLPVLIREKKKQLFQPAARPAPSYDRALGLSWYLEHIFSTLARYFVPFAAGHETGYHDV